MNAEKVFVDTNILFYAHDLDAGEKHTKARQLVLDLWHADPLPVISVQVLQELYVNLQKNKISETICQEVIHDYMAWNVIDMTAPLLLEGIRVRERYQLSFWDALIIAAAQQAGAGIVYSEDMNDGQTFDTVTVRNPLV